MEKVFTQFVTNNIDYSLLAINNTLVYLAIKKERNSCNLLINTSQKTTDKEINNCMISYSYIKNYKAIIQRHNKKTMNTYNNSFNSNYTTNCIIAGQKIRAH